MHHLIPKKAGAHLSKQANASLHVARAFKLLGLRSIEIDKSQDEWPGFVVTSHNELPTRAKLNGHIVDQHFDLRHLTGRSVRNRHDDGLVFVSQGHVQSTIHGAM